MPLGDALRRWWHSVGGSDASRAPLLDGPKPRDGQLTGLLTGEEHPAQGRTHPGDPVERGDSHPADDQPGEGLTRCGPRSGPRPGRPIGRSLKTTNILESVNSQAEERCGRVDHWQNSKQKQRWLAAALLDIEPRLRRLVGYRHLPTLQAAIIKELKLESVEQRSKRAA